MSKPKTVNLQISNCCDCPHSKRIASPPTGDSFDMCDEDLICTNPDLTGKFVKVHYNSSGSDIKGRAVAVSNRPWQTRADAEVPKWCPLEAGK